MRSAGSRGDCQGVKTFTRRSGPDVRTPYFGIDAGYGMRWVLTALVAVVVQFVAACSGTGTGGETKGLGHIHGLGINPANGDLYAGTHYGVYRLASGREPELVGDVVQDFMGFTVAGPDHFLGSGHPDQGDRQAPSNLGLIESTDGGQSWNSVSLSGEADFHSLESRHNTIYGLDGLTSALLVSGPNGTWERRAEIRAADIAVSPRTPDEILATTAAGLVRSIDQGRTFSPVAAEPSLTLLSWPDDGPLVGVDPSGKVYTSTDSGASWRAGHELASRPQALLAAGDGLVFVATAAGVHRSEDNGETFRTFVESQP